MIFQFPDLETFRLAVTSAQVPPEVSAAPAEVAFDPEGRPSVRSAAGIPPKAMQNALRKLGVKQTKEHFSETILTVDCWPQIIPVSKGKAELEITSNTPVLFEMPSSEFASVVTEMLRLGNDRQSFRTIAPAHGHGERVLLKVIGPPYYTLLRAIDKQTQSGANVVAYLERSPRVWVEIGHEHPLAGIVRPADGQVLLLRPERDWTVVADGTFQDIYDVLDFQLPAAAVEWQESQLKGKLSVPLRLAPGNAADVAELWVLTEDAVDQLDSLVRDADERLMARLLFAVAQEGDQTTIVLKTRPSRLDPPVLSLSKAHAFKPYWKLPNLFLPVGKRLQPTLRRDAVRRLLANNSAQVVWLMPNTDGKFTPEVLPDEAFRPLEDWIDYIIDHEHAPLAAWVQATRFDFDSFICPEDQPDKPKGPPPERTKKPKKPKGEPAADGADLPPIHLRGNKPKGTPGDEAEFALPVEVVAPSEVKVKLRELEQEFVSMEGPLDSPERLAIWPKMARLNTLDGRELEAAICWANAFWELPDVPFEGAWAWLQSEDRRARKTPTAEEFNAALDSRDQSPTLVRTLVARVLYACKLNPVPESLLKRLPRIREYLEKHDGMLGVRAAWLAWRHLARADGQTDVLALARVRDRLLQRLLAEGLNKERDLPYFLRTAGEQNSDRMRLVRDRAMKVHKLVTDWHARENSGEKNPSDLNPKVLNRPYVDLMFAFGLAKLAEVTIAKDLMKASAARLHESSNKPSHTDAAPQFLADAFVWRVEQAIKGKPHTGPLSPELRQRLATIDTLRGSASIYPRYVVDRLRDVSWILEPQVTLEPYGTNIRLAGSPALRALGGLADEYDPARVRNTIIDCLRGNLSAEERMKAMVYSLDVAPRVGEDFCIGLVSKVAGEIVATTKGEHAKRLDSEWFDLQCKMLGKAIILAANYNHVELLHTLFQSFIKLLSSRPDSDRFLGISSVAQQCVTGLRKCGMKSEIEYFLSETTKLLLRGRALSQVRIDSASYWPESLTLILSVAEGWVALGDMAEAKPFLDEARSTILDKSNYHIVRNRTGSYVNAAGANFQALTKLICTYVMTVAQGPLDEALLRIEELIHGIGKLPNTATTAPYFAILQLRIVDALVRSLVCDNMALGDQARRWLDDDEYLVRRRIHGDMKRLLARSGL